MVQDGGTRYHSFWKSIYEGKHERDNYDIITDDDIHINDREKVKHHRALFKYVKQRR